MRQRGLFEELDRLSEITKLGDPLVVLNSKINWEGFRPLLQEIKSEPNPNNIKNAGRKPFDEVMMFKVLLLQQYYNISDDQMEFQLKDRRSFERFVCGGETLFHMPDAKTIWLYREKFKDAGISRKAFKYFKKELQKSGIIGKSGKIVDASFVEVPKQRNSRDENQQIKDGRIPDDWSDAKKAQKDIDARWTEKNKQKYYGYKNHIVSDKKGRVILDYIITSAEVHDSQVLDDLIGKPRIKDEPLWGDSAYRSKDIEQRLKKSKYKSMINEKGYRNHPLTETQKRRNRKKSKVRAAVEHIFGLVTWMGGDECRYIGIERVEEATGLINLLFNIRRYCYLT